MANQAYLKAKLAMWTQGYAAALKGEPRGDVRFAKFDMPWQEGYDKGLEIKSQMEMDGISLNK